MQLLAHSRRSRAVLASVCLIFLCASLVGVAANSQPEPDHSPALAALQTQSEPTPTEAPVRTIPVTYTAQPLGDEIPISQAQPEENPEPALETAPEVQPDPAPAPQPEPEATVTSLPTPLEPTATFYSDPVPVVPKEGQGVPEDLELAGTFLATAYTVTGKTSTGTWTTVNRTLAVNPYIIPYGSHVWMFLADGTLVGDFYAEDTGSNMLAHPYVVDIYMGEDTYDECVLWGAQHVTLYIQPETE